MQVILFTNLFIWTNQLSTHNKNIHISFFRRDHPDIKILAFDHNKDDLLAWTNTMLEHPENSYTSGMAFHWYGYGADRWMDGTYGYDAVNATAHLLASLGADKILLASEGCSCPDVRVDNWQRAER